MPRARTILGIHVAGSSPVEGSLSSTRRGYSVIVTQEALLKCLEALKDKTGYVPEEDTSESDLLLVAQSGGVPLERIPEALVPHIPSIPDLTFKDCNRVP